jgi:hypothetical protein
MRFARPAALAVAALSLPAGALLASGFASAAPHSAANGGSASTYPGAPAVGIKPLIQPATRSLAVAGAPVTMADSSQNWAGYVSTGNRFRFIQATFRVPALNCRKTPGTAKVPALVGEWVGLDGLTGSRVTVEQDGISGQCAKGVPSYAAWWEMFPKVPVYPGVFIRPGDTIQASVYYSAKTRQYRLTLSDLSNGQGFSTWRRCGASSCRNGSAEVITEAPAMSVSGNRLYPLADCGTESYSHIQITDAAGQRGGFASSNWQNTQLVMVDNSNRVKAATSSLSHGTAFKTYWKRAN